MKNSLLLWIALIVTSVSFAQNPPTTATTFSKNILKAQIQQELETFITDNWDLYEIPASEIQLLYYANGGFVRSEILDDIKRTELRKMYFNNYPNKAINYNKNFSTLESGTIRYACDNGGFENQNDTNVFSDDYDFFTKYLGELPINSPLVASRLSFRGPPPILGLFGLTCNVNLILNTFPASVIPNDYSQINYISKTKSTVANPVYDESLDTKYGFGIEIPVVHSGNYAVRLNNNITDFETNNRVRASKMTKTFIANSSSVSYAYNYIAIARNTSGSGLSEESHFIVRLTDSNDIIISQQCIAADYTDTNTFKIAGNTSGSHSPLLYTDWQCATFNIGSEYQGQEVKLEFLVTNSNHEREYGIAYIDDICTTGCTDPVNGLLDLDFDSEESGLCPELPLEVCGSVKAPRTAGDNPTEYADLESLEIEIFKDETLIKTLPITIETEPVVSVSSTDMYGGYYRPSSTLGDLNTFCFDIYKSYLESVIEPLGDYTFKAIADFMFSDGTAITKETPLNTITFGNCEGDCPERVTLDTDVESTEIKTQQASIAITATNEIKSGGQGIYHGAKEVVLNDGFYGATGSKFYGYIAGCTEESGLRPASLNKSVDNNVYQMSDVALVKVSSNESKSDNNLIIAPNPNNGLFTIGFTKIIDVHVIISEINGREVYNRKVNNALNIEVDMTNKASGVYLVQLILAEQLITKKIVKR